MRKNKDRKSAQLCIRLEEKDAEKFRAFCDKWDISFAVALKLMMASQLQKSEEILQLVREQEKKTSEARDLCEKYRKEKYCAQRAAARLRRDIIQTSKDIISVLLDGAMPPMGEGDPLKKVSLKRAKENHGFRGYEYPEGVSYVIADLELLVYGKGYAPARFLLARQKDGRAVKVRWYPNDYYIGVSPLSKAYALAGSTWILGCRKAEDGAVDMIAGIPLAAAANRPDLVRPGEEGGNPSLNDMIWAIEHGKMRK